MQKCLRSNGSTSSASRSFVLYVVNQAIPNSMVSVSYTKRSVFPRTYSFGACKSNRIALLLLSACISSPRLGMPTHQTNIHSCRSFPCASCLGHTSKKKYMSFLSGFDLLGMTNRMMCMRRPGCGSPLSIIERTLFCSHVRPPTPAGRGSRSGMSAP